MFDHFPFYIGLLIVILLLIMLAKKLRIAYPIVLVIAGLLISFIPGLPRVHIEPELIFVIFLPPLLYEAAWATSWKELWRWRRIIVSFAFVVVFLTALSVALVANHFIPGFSLALGFVLGGIVSPPDAVSATAILKFVKVPRRMVSILEGESLMNDASSLIIFRFALVAVATGQFVWHEAALSFGWMVTGGVGIGLAIGWIFMKAHKLLPTDPQIDIVLTIVTPYVMYIAAEEAHCSGVLAVVCGGLLLANKRHNFLSSQSRLRGFNVWQSLVFVLNGLVFMLIGLELPEITAELGGMSLSSAIGYGLLISAVLIIGRILAAYGAVLVTLIARNFITVADKRNPGARTPFLLGWSGMRGVVSLAAALSIPVQLDNGTIFPQRNLILFITFVVILVTLLVQGLTLPYLIKKIGFPNFGDTLPEEEADKWIKRQLATQALRHLQTSYKDHLESDGMLKQLVYKWEHKTRTDAPEENISGRHKEIYLAIIQEQRTWLLIHSNKEQNLDEEIVRKHLYYLDLEEERLALLKG
ncbi:MULTISPECIES: Na+/H+ antiporter [Olivibacter]|jgi:CPA1 family monovalent cation:H+ antiporter|uniref:Na+/H+ antiporter n=2 Tax=Sphingobacteriaceae TaxID=84566 RepID=F4CF25_SPHS2|nr:MULTISPECIES: Na+/H+ antiporter [Olivibacter]MDM8176358.1 Na+/H+ antiporter [Olivibacter sp. 47]QEL01171.1 Na+/H+ antiporter [Olivibacter sp. LS-1]